MDSKDYWQTFEHTGSIQSYLSYKDRQIAEAAVQPWQEEETSNAEPDRNSGTGAAGSQGGGIG